MFLAFWFLWFAPFACVLADADFGFPLCFGFIVYDPFQDIGYESACPLNKFTFFRHPTLVAPGFFPIPHTKS